MYMGYEKSPFSTYISLYLPNDIRCGHSYNGRLYDGPLLCSFNVAIKGLSFICSLFRQVRSIIKLPLAKA